MADPRMPIGGWDITAGEPLEITLNFVVNGVSALNLATYGTGWAADLRRNPDDGFFISFDVDSSGAAGGVLVLSLTGDQTALLTDENLGNEWGFDLCVTGGAVTPQYPFRGQIVGWEPYTHG